MEEKALMEARGWNGQLYLFENKVRISRKGFLALAAQGLKGDKDIMIKEISSVQFKRVGLTMMGYIQFTFRGGQESKSGWSDAHNDENTVTFIKKQEAAFQKIKEAIEEKMRSTETGGTKPSNLGELEKLAELKEKGIITEEEFNKKKKQILGL